MPLIDEIGFRRAAFYFVERAYPASTARGPSAGPRELLAVAARWLTPGSWDAAVPDLLPVWQGSYLPFKEAARRFGVPEVWAVVIGCRDARQRRGLVPAVRRSSPIGMFSVEPAAEWPPLQASLPLTGFILPNAAITFTGAGRYVERETGLDIIAVEVEEGEMLSMSATWGEPDLDLLVRQMLITLTKRVGRSMRGASAADGFDALLDQSFDLYGLGAINLAGAVAGVAFETLMRSALDAAGQRWAAALEAQGAQVKLNDVIGKVASAGGWNPDRLHGYRQLRNDFAHRLGDDASNQRDQGERWAELGRFLRWLDQQKFDKNGGTELVSVEPAPNLSSLQLLNAAIAAGDEAAKATAPMLIRVQDDEFEPFGSAWVVVPDKRLSFTRWLIDEHHADASEHGALLHAPYQGLERNLAWAFACASRLRKAEIVAFDAGAPD